MERLKRAYAAFEDYLSGSLLFIGLCMIMLNVVLRYFWGRPQSLLDEFSLYFIIWGLLLGFCVALRSVSFPTPWGLPFAFFILSTAINWLNPT